MEYKPEERNNIVPTGIQLIDVAMKVGASFGWTFVGVIIFIVGVRLYDMLDPIDYQAEIQKGNIAAAIKLAAVILGLAAITIAAIVT
jgi:uncharacterized membrane protein YjfL (UPF0719 family)